MIKNNNDTDEVGEIDTDKEYLTMDEAYAITAADNAGTPAAAITGKGELHVVVSYADAI